MSNEQNLIPNEARSPEELRENGRKGGVKSGEVRRRKRTLREIAETYGASESQSFPGLTNDEALMLAQYREAIQKGNTTAAAFIRDTLGQKPHEIIETPNLEMKPLIDLTKRKKNGEK